MSKLLAFFVLIALTHNVYSSRILGLFPHTGKSHQMVFDPLLRMLAERGHHVTVVSFFPVKNPPANYTDVSLEGIADLGLETFDLSFYENPKYMLRFLGLDKIEKQITEFYPLAEMALNRCSKLVEFEPLAEALRSDYDVLLVENFNSDCMLGLAHVYGQSAPLVYLSSTGLMPWSTNRFGIPDNPSHVPIISSTFTNPMSFSQRLENSILNIYYKMWYRYAIQLKEKEIIEKHFGRRIPDLQDLAKNASLILTNAFHSLNGVRPLVPGVVEVGGMHLDHSRKIIPKYIERFLNESEHGVVLLSLGSLIKTATMPKYKEQIIINALSKLKQRVIWKYEDSDPEGTLIGNILRVRWLPQYELLRNMFAMYVERVLIPELQRVSGVLERKAAAVGCTKLLCDSQHFRQGALAHLWPSLMQALISLFELPTDESTLPDDHFLEVDDAPGYQAQYSQLTCAKGVSNDPLASIEDPKRYLAESLGNMSRASPGLLPPRLSGLDERHRNVLQMYLEAYSVQIC